MMKKTISALTVACFLLSSSAAHCSQEPQKKTTNLMPKLIAVVSTFVMAAAVYCNPLHMPAQNLPANPIQNLNATQTIDRACFGFSVEQNDGRFLSNVYGPRYTTDILYETDEPQSTLDDLNEMYMQDALADIKNNYPQATINYYDCKYFTHKPYNKK